MDDPGLNGAISTATYFLQLFPYALNTGDLTDWALLSHPECIFCGGISDEVTRLKGLGQHQDGTRITVRSATGVEIDPAWFSVDILFTQGGWTVVDSPGSVVDEATNTESLKGNIVVVRDAGRWLIRGVQVDPADA
jgi:hypothetical protein